MKLGSYRIIKLHRLIFPIGLLIFMFAYYWQIKDIPNPAENLAMVYPVLGLLLVLTVINSIREIQIEKIADVTSVQDQEKEKEKDNKFSFKKIIQSKIFVLVVITSIFLILIPFFGLVVMTAFYLPVVLWGLGNRNWLLIIFLPIGAVILIKLLFGYWMNIPIP